jgi:uncharacterized membrane protein
VSKHSKERRFKQQQQFLANRPSGNFQIMAQSMHFSGPLPPPELLAKYNEATPGGAERVLAMAEKQSNHRQELEKQVVDANCRAQRTGSVYGFLICMASLASGTFLIYVGKSAQGLVPIIGALGGLVAVFIVGKNKQQKELVEKSSALAQTQNPQPTQ